MLRLRGRPCCLRVLLLWRLLLWRLGLLLHRAWLLRWLGGRRLCLQERLLRRWLWGLRLRLQGWLLRHLLLRLWRPLLRWLLLRLWWRLGSRRWHLWCLPRRLLGPRLGQRRA